MRQLTNQGRQEKRKRGRKQGDKNSHNWRQSIRGVEKDLESRGKRGDPGTITSEGKGRGQGEKKNHTEEEKNGHLIIEEKQIAIPRG